LVENNEYIYKISNNKYINIESYKKDGSYVRTPVLFVIKDNKIYFRSSVKSGKIKRIKNNSSVRLIPCGINGRVKDNKWSSGHATLANTSEINITDRLFTKKYGIVNMLLKLLYKIRKINLILVCITLNNDA